MITREDVIQVFEGPGMYCPGAGMYSHFRAFMAGVILARVDLFPGINEYAWSTLEKSNVGWDHVLLWSSGFGREDARLICMGTIDDELLNARALAAMRMFLEMYFQDVPPASSP